MIQFELQRRIDKYLCRSLTQIKADTAITVYLKKKFVEDNDLLMDLVDWCAENSVGTVTMPAFVYTLCAGFESYGHFDDFSCYMCFTNIEDFSAIKLMWGEYFHDVGLHIMGKPEDDNLWCSTKDSAELKSLQAANILRLTRKGEPSINTEVG